MERTKEERTIENDNIVKSGDFECEGDFINSTANIGGNFTCNGNLRASRIICGGKFICRGNVSGNCFIKAGNPELEIGGFEDDKDLDYIDHGYVTF